MVRSSTGVYWGRDKTIMSQEFEPTDEQLICKHEVLRRILTMFGIAYRCEKCELIFDQPDIRMRRM